MFPFSFTLLLNRIENQERFFLYLILSVSTGILLCLLVIITRFIINRRNGDDAENGGGGGKIPASTTGETALSSSRVSGDVTCLESEQKFPAQELETSYMPTIVRNEVGRIILLYFHFKIFCDDNIKRTDTLTQTQ